MVKKLLFIILFLVLCMNLGFSITVNSLPYLQSFDSDAYTSSMVWVTDGATHQWLSNGGWNGGAAKLTPVYTPSNLVDGQGYSGIGSFYFSDQIVSSPILSARWLIYYGADYQRYAGGNKLTIFVRDQGDRPMIITRRVGGETGEFPRTYGSCDGTVCWYEGGDYWPTGSETFLVGEGYRAEEWISVEFEANTQTGEINIYLTTQDGEFNDDLYVSQTMDTLGGDWTYIDLIGGYMATATQITADTYFLIDEIVIDNQHIGPPVGFVGSSGGTISPTDTTNPSITITSPTTLSSYLTTASTINLGGTSLDNVVVSSVNWSCNSGCFGSGSAIETTNWTISSIDLIEGVNNIQVTVTDSSGNTAIDSIEVTYSPIVVQPPIISAVEVDSTYASVSYDALNLIDGNLNTQWASEDSIVNSHYVILNLNDSEELNNITIHWAYNDFRSSYMSPQQLMIEYWDGDSYVLLETISNLNNIESYSVFFDSVTTDRIRLYQPANMGASVYSEVMWLTEIEYSLKQLRLENTSLNETMLENPTTITSSSSSSSISSPYSSSSSSSREKSVYIPPVCEPNFEYSLWSDCVNFKQSRIKTDLNNCGDEEVVIENRVCYPENDEKANLYLNVKKFLLEKVEKRIYMTNLEGSYNEFFYLEEKAGDDSFIVYDKESGIEFLARFSEEIEGKYYYSLKEIDQNTYNELKELDLMNSGGTDEVGSLVQNFKNANSLPTSFIIVGFILFLTIILGVIFYVKKIHFSNKPPKNLN